ncbi:nitroreductase family protein [Candidatus Woesearchaeota archaeon]|nr:nitroreductase family protein [Candidatus Woesearchaeota archaeon]
MDALKCMRERRSIRAYSDKKIDRRLLNEILGCGGLAPTARNLQPWHFIVVTDGEKLRRIASLATYGSFIKNAAACIVVCGNKDNNHLVEDGSAATQNILLAATSFGIGSCWVAGWKRTYNPELMKLLKIPLSEKIVSIIPLGYPAERPAPRKKELDDIVHWEEF